MNSKNNFSQYGTFDNTSCEFVLKNPHTPRAWQHLLSNENYLLVLSQWASGYSVYKSIFTNNVTKNTWPTDDSGRFFYLRDAQTGNIWSPMVWPVKNTLDGVENYICHYGHGYLSWESISNGTRSKLTSIVTLNDCVELYSLELENMNDFTRQLDVFSYLEWEFSGTPTELGAALKTYFDQNSGCHVGEMQLPPQYWAKQTGFLGCDREIISFDGWRKAFMGQPGGIFQPDAVMKGFCSGSVSPIIGNACGAIHTRLEIPAGSTEKINFIVGIVEDKHEIIALRDRYLAYGCFEKELARIKQYWKEKLSGIEVHTHDEAMDNFSNTWLKYQMVQNARWTRWAAHKGFRDVLNDSAGLRLLAPADSREMILTAAGKQKSNGHAPRQWSLSPWGGDDWRDYRDSCFWLVYAAEKYMKETGDFKILDIEVPFSDIRKSTTLFKHLSLAMDFLYQNRGKHGLCNIGHGDWLDSLNAAGTGGSGESIWLTQAACYALKEMKHIAMIVEQKGEAQKYGKWRNELADIINETGWDGEWYRQAYDDSGNPIGSATCYDGGQIFLNPQSWAVLSGVATESRAKQAFDSIEKKLSSEYGCLCFSPVYNSYNPNIGRLCLWPSEAASAYCHGTLFKIVADCMLGNGDSAWQTLRSLTPASGNFDVSVTGTEPFCLTNTYAGPNWPYPGWSYTGWWTGTASWAFQAIVEWIFGIRADYDSLIIDPCLPKSWKKVQIIRPFRGCRYNITIVKPDNICKGQIKLSVNGKAVHGNSIPPCDLAESTIICEIF